jgi:alpha-1,2-mannosyltransferase
MRRHWLTRERLLLYSAAVLIVYVVLAAVTIGRMQRGVDAHGNPAGGDFIAFWGASHLGLSGDAVGAYDLNTLFEAEKLAVPDSAFHATRPWEYPPMFLLAVLPSALLPYFPALLLFLGLGFAAYLMMMRRILAGPGMLPPLLGFAGVMMNFAEGQNGLLTAALGGGALLLLRAAPLSAGVLMGLLTIKPHLGVLLPLALVCGRHWRALLSATLTAAAYAGVSVLVLGPDTMAAFLAHLPQVAAWVEGGYLPWAKMPTFFAFGRTLGLPVAAAYALHFTMAALAALGVAWVWLRCADFSLRAAALLAGTLLVSPYLYDYDLAWLGPALAWFAVHALRRGWRRGERELLVLLWLLPALIYPLQHLLRLQLAPWVLLAFLLAILRRARIAIQSTS